MVCYATQIRTSQISVVKLLLKRKADLIDLKVWQLFWLGTGWICDSKLDFIAGPCFDSSSRIACILQAAADYQLTSEAATWMNYDLATVEETIQRETRPWKVQRLCQG